MQEQQTNKYNCSHCVSKEHLSEISRSGFIKADRELLHEIAKTTEMASLSIKDMLSSCDECACCCEDVLKCQLESYENIYRTAKSALEEIGEEVDKTNGMQKMMLWTQIKIDMMMDDSNSKMAQMMIEGTAMGICEVAKALNNYRDISSKSATAIAQTTLDAMETFEKQLRKFL